MERFHLYDFSGCYFSIDNDIPNSLPEVAEDGVFQLTDANKAWFLQEGEDVLKLIEPIILDNGWFLRLGFTKDGEAWVKDNIRVIPLDVHYMAEGKTGHAGYVVSVSDLQLFCNKVYSFYNRKI